MLAPIDEKGPASREDLSARQEPPNGTPGRKYFGRDVQVSGPDRNTSMTCCESTDSALQRRADLIRERDLRRMKTVVGVLDHRSDADRYEYGARASIPGYSSRQLPRPSRHQRRIRSLGVQRSRRSPNPRGGTQGGRHIRSVKIRARHYATDD